MANRLDRPLHPRRRVGHRTRGRDGASQPIGPRGPRAHLQVDGSGVAEASPPAFQLCRRSADRHSALSICATVNRKCARSHLREQRRAVYGGALPFAVRAWISWSTLLLIAGSLIVAAQVAALAESRLAINAAYCQAR